MARKMNLHVKAIFFALGAAVFSCLPVSSQAQDPLTIDQRVSRYADFYSDENADVAYALPNHHPRTMLDGSLDSLIFVDAHLIAISGAFYSQGWEQFQFYEVQQSLIGASAYVSMTLESLSQGSIRMIEYKINPPEDFEGVPMGVGAALIDGADQIFPTDCLVLDLLLFGQRSQRIATAAKAFLDNGVVPNCKWSDET